MKSVGNDNPKVTDRARMLIATLAEPGELPFDELLERIEHQSNDNEPAGRLWIAAVREVERAGHITADQANSLVDAIIHSIIMEWDTRDAEGGELSERIRALAVLIDPNAGEPGGKRKRSKLDKAARAKAKNELDALLTRRSARHNVMLEQACIALGEEQLARMARDGGRDFRVRMLDALMELYKNDHIEKRGGSLVWYPWPDSAEEELTPPPRTTRPEVYDEQYAQALEDLVERWRAAVSEETPWTVQAALDFAYIAAIENMEEKGDLELAAIQRARELGILDPDLAWLLLDRIAESMVDADADAVLQGIEERKDDVFEEKEVEMLDEAQERRMGVLKRGILRAAGEDDMARVMKEKPAEFRARLAAAAKEWDVTQ
jgi:hypothetical protein